MTQESMGQAEGHPRDRGQGGCPVRGERILLGFAQRGVIIELGPDSPQVSNVDRLSAQDMGHLRSERSSIVLALQLLALREAHSEIQEMAAGRWGAAFRMVRRDTRSWGALQSRWASLAAACGVESIAAFHTARERYVAAWAAAVKRCRPYLPELEPEAAGGCSGCGRSTSTYVVMRGGVGDDRPWRLCGTCWVDRDSAAERQRDADAVRRAKRKSSKSKQVDMDVRAPGAGRMVGH